MERDHLIELVVLVLLVLPLEQPHRLIELWPAPDGARSSVRDESAESAPVLEVVVTRERGGPTLPQIPRGSAFRRDVHGAPRGIEGMAERCDVRRASPVGRGHPANASAIEIPLLLRRETGMHGSGDESKNAPDALSDEPVDQVRGQRVRVRRRWIRGWPLRQTDRGNCRVVGDPPDHRAEEEPVAGADDRQDFCDGAVDRARQHAHPVVDRFSGDRLDLIRELRMKNRLGEPLSGFEVLALWEAKTDRRTEFVYLLSSPDQASKEAAWRDFLADPEWKEIKRATNAEYGDLVGEIEDRVLMSTVYSPRPFVSLTR